MQKLLSRLELLKFGVMALLLVVPLYPKFPFIRVPGTYVSIRPEDLLLLAVFVVWFLSSWKKGRKLLKDPLTVAIVLFWLVTGVSTLAGVVLTQTVTPLLGLFHWARRVEYMIALPIGISALGKPKDVVFFVKCLVLVSFFVFIYALGQKYLAWPVVTTQNLEQAKGIALIYTPGAHLVSTFAGHYDLASFVVLTSPLFFSFLFVKSKEKSGWAFKAGLFIAILMSFWLLVGSLSRISLVAYLMSVTLTLMILKRYKFIPLFIAGVFALSLFSGDLVSRYTQIIEVTVRQIMNLKPKLLLEKDLFVVYGQDSFPERRGSSTPIPVSTPVFEDRSTAIRFNVEWPRAIRAFTKNPLLGTGFSSITLATDNDYLRLLGEVGILGFASFLLVLTRVGVGFIKALPFPKSIGVREAYLAGILGAFPGVLLNAVFIDIFEASKFAVLFWLLVGFGVSLARYGKASH